MLIQILGLVHAVTVVVQVLLVLIRIVQSRVVTELQRLIDVDVLLAIDAVNVVVKVVVLILVLFLLPIVIRIVQTLVQQPLVRRDQIRLGLPVLHSAARARLPLVVVVIESGIQEAILDLFAVGELWVLCVKDSVGLRVAGQIVLIDRVNEEGVGDGRLLLL